MSELGVDAAEVRLGELTENAHDALEQRLKRSAAEIVHAQYPSFLSAAIGLHRAAPYLLWRAFA